VKALFLVEGWHTKYIVAMVGVSVLISLCVIALTILIKKDVELGLSAGSYTISSAAVVLGLLAMLSSIF
jgi:hypothetical protein